MDEELIRLALLFFEHHLLCSDNVSGVCATASRVCSLANGIAILKTEPTFFPFSYHIFPFIFSISSLHKTSPMPVPLSLLVPYVEVVLSENNWSSCIGLIPIPSSFTLRYMISPEWEECRQTVLPGGL